MTVHAERGMAAPPEVVFNTATDPQRNASWLPVPLREGTATRAEPTGEVLRARWSAGPTPGWSARLQVRAADSGGAAVRLDLEAEPAEQRLAEIAEESLANLARAVDDNLTPG